MEPISPVIITARRWKRDEVGSLSLRTTVLASGASKLRIGALGFALLKLIVLLLGVGESM
jgi:hypothetical protein